MVTIKRAIATLSWIDPKAGLPEDDKRGDPGPQIGKTAIVGRELYRFSNFLNVTLTVEKEKVIGHCIEPDSGMYRSPSFLNIQSKPVGEMGQYSVSLGSAAVFRQVVGCRTVSPETIGEAVGTVLGGPIGKRLGREAAERASAFPPIWTEIELTVNADGSWTHQLLRHSLFPSVSYYAINAASSFARVCTSYDGVPNLQQWKKRGWGAVMAGPPGPTAGNPWSLSDPSGWGGSSAEKIPLSTGPYCKSF